MLSAADAEVVAKSDVVAAAVAVADEADEYLEVAEVEGEPVLQPVFSAIHETTWAGVPGFRFVREQGGQCSFLFE